MKKLIAVVIPCIVSGTLYASVETKEFDAGGLESLNLKNLTGRITVGLSEDGKAHVSANKIDFEPQCSLKMNRSGDELVVEVAKEKAWFNRDVCKIHFEVKVPKAVDLELRNGSGDITVNGTRGEIDFKVGSGDIKINAEVEELEGKTGSGSVVASGLLGDAEIKTGSGDVTLSYGSAPKEGEVDVKTGSGNATISFPASMKILTDFKAGSGRLYNELGDSSDAPFKVSMRAGSGDLKILKLR